MLRAHEDFYPDYPEDWTDVIEEASHDYMLPTHVTNVASRTTYALTEANGAVLQIAPKNFKQAVVAIGSLSTDLHEHSHTVHGIKDIVLAQNRNIDQDIFPENVRAFAPPNYFKRKKELLFLNSNGVFCAKYPPSQRLLHERPCRIVMPQLYQHEILFRAHQGTSKVVARIQ